MNLLRVFVSLAMRGAVVRREQFFALMSDWAESPLYGYGHGQ